MGLVHANDSKHFLIDQYLHDRVTPATLSPKPLAYDKQIDPSEMPRISTCTDEGSVFPIILFLHAKYSCTVLISQSS